VILNGGDSSKAGAGDEAEGASDDVDIVCIERKTSLYNDLVTLEPALGLVNPTDAFSPWYDVEGGCYIDQPTKTWIL
jgi:hypothetical protein